MTPSALTGRLGELLAAIDGAGDPVAAEQLARYFQVRPGGYGEGDTFIGVRLSDLRRLTRPYASDPLATAELDRLLVSPVHEHRLAAVVLLSIDARRAARRTDRERLRAVYELFMARLDCVNNWDLVDAGAAPIVGGYLLDRSREPLYELGESQSVWRRRTALVATHRFLRAGQSNDTYALSRRVFDDPHDLVHKAAGWMLREAGKIVDEEELKSFLTEHGAEMPRTMLRYAIQRLPPDTRRRFLGVRSARPRR